MKILFFSFFLLTSLFSFAKEKRILKIKAQVLRMAPSPEKDILDIGLADHAAVFKGHKNISSCLAKSIKEKKSVELELEYGGVGMLIRKCQ